jgi:hypothetical protein
MEVCDIHGRKHRIQEPPQFTLVSKRLHPILRRSLLKKRSIAHTKKGATMRDNRAVHSVIGWQQIMKNNALSHLALRKKHLGVATFNLDCPLAALLKLCEVSFVQRFQRMTVTCASVIFFLPRQAW